MSLILIALFSISLAVAFFAVVYMVVSRRTVLEERLESIAAKTEETFVFEKPQTPWHKLLANLGQRIPLRPSEHGKYTRMLIAAGIRKERLPVFMGIKLLLAAALPAAYVIFLGLPMGAPGRNLWLISGALMIAGFLLPSFELSRMVKKRQLEIFHGLPDVLDLMTVCVEAGLSMEGAMLRISEDKQFKDSPLSKEMKTAIQESRAGKPRHEALKDMGERTMLDDLKSFCTMLIQTEKLGTSLAQSLRIHSDSLRTIRRQKAEEQAAKTAVKLLFPLVFLIMPAIFVVMLMPALLRIIKLFSTL